MKKMFLILGVAAMTAFGASSARAGGLHFSFGLPLPPLPPLPGLSFGFGGYGNGYAYPYSYGYAAPGYYSGPAYGPTVVVPPYGRPYYGYGYRGYGPRFYAAPRAWRGNGWGRGGGRYHH